MEYQVPFFDTGMTQSGIEPRVPGYWRKLFPIANYVLTLAQLVGTVEYTDCISVDG